MSLRLAADSALGSNALYKGINKQIKTVPLFLNTTNSQYPIHEWIVLLSQILFWSSFVGKNPLIYLTSLSLQCTKYIGCLRHYSLWSYNIKYIILTIQSVHLSFPGNRTHNLGAASATLYNNTFMQMLLPKVTCIALKAYIFISSCIS